MPGFLEQFPYANYQSLNIDWVLAILKNMDEALNNDFTAYISKWIEANYDRLFFQASYDAETETIIISRGE